MVRFDEHTALPREWTSHPHMTTTSAADSTPRPTQSRLSVQSLGSGSSGNAFLIKSGNTNVMLDFGVGIRTMNRSLIDHGLRADALDAILITHEHSDHVKTLSCVMGKDVPIISTAGTRRRADIPPPQWEEIGFHKPVVVGDLTVWAIAVKHDAAEPCGYLIETPEARVSIFTDLGSWHERLVEPLRASDLIVLESNHDEEMLKRGPYPAYLKRRVASPVGHLSNDVCAASLASVLDANGKRPEIWLAHLSETNNAPALAEQATTDALNERGLFLNVIALPRKSPGPTWVPTKVRDEPSWAPRPVVPASFQLTIDALL